MGPAEVAKYLGMTERTIYMWAQQGKIPAFKVGSVWRFRRNEVDRWLESTRSGPSVDEVEPLTPYIEPSRSKWRIKKDEEEADKAITDACRAYIESTLNSVGREGDTRAHRRLIIEIGELKAAQFIVAVQTAVDEFGTEPIKAEYGFALFRPTSRIC